MKQMEQMQQQQEMMEQQAQAGQQPGQAPAPPEGVNPAPGRVDAAPGGGEGAGAAPVPPMPMQNMNFAPLKGGQNKDYTRAARGEGEPHDVDALGEARKSDDDPTKAVDATKAPKNWVEGLMAKGYTTPLIKQVSDNGKKMWFSQDGIDFVADLHSTGVTHVQKASFYRGPSIQKPDGPSVNPGASYSPTGNNKQGEWDYDEEDENAQ